MILHFSKNGPFPIKVFQTRETGNTATAIPCKIGIFRTGSRLGAGGVASRILLY
jgi:hypothetical protein